MPKIVYFWSGSRWLLMAAEMFVPGAFLLWFGFAAGGDGRRCVLVLPDMPFLWQAIASACSVHQRSACTGAGSAATSRRATSRCSTSARQLIGPHLPLHEPIVERLRQDPGRTMRSGPCTAPTCPAGTRRRA